MRVCLVGEGTYPVVRGGVSTWSDQLVRGLPDVKYRVTVLTAGRAQSVYDLPRNVTSVSAVDMWGPIPARKMIRARQRDAFEEAWEIICGHAYGRGGRTPEITRAAWLTLTRPDIAERLWWLLNDRRSVAILASIRRRAGRHPSSGRDVAHSMAYVARMIMPCALPPVDADVCHVTSVGPALLAALPSYAQGVPILLSEHGVFFRERMMALRGTEWSFLQRNMVTAFVRSMTTVGYEVATSIAPVSDFNGRWAKALGADPAKVVTIHNGVDVGRLTYNRDEPTVPTIAFVGRIDPLKDLETLVRAAPAIAARIPNVEVRLIGPVPETNTEYARDLKDLVARLGMENRVSMPGPTTDPGAAYHSGTMAVLSSISEGFPYGALEPMACGRPVVATNVGGIPEVVGDAGVLVHSRDPAALAEACITVLSSRRLRDKLARAGRERVEGNFTLELMVGRVRSRYGEILGEVPAPAVAPVPHPRREPVHVEDRVDPYLPPQRDHEWANAMIKARFQG